MDATVTLADATKLYEEKVQRLRSDMGAAEKAARDATTSRDKALSEVTTLHEEKSALMEQMAQAKAEMQRIKDSLAEHRKTVEASLATQEAQARKTLDAAVAKEAALKEEAIVVRQHRAQVMGLKQTLATELDTLSASLTKLAQQTKAALSVIPD